MKLTHISITARDADRLAAFYFSAFGCTLRRPRTNLSGKIFSTGNGLPGVEIFSVWLSLPDTNGPFLEILEYSKTASGLPPQVNQPGYGHLSFAVDDIHKTCAAVLENGGIWQGKITNLGSIIAPWWAVYMRDPEGNILELEQIQSLPQH